MAYRNSKKEKVDHDPKTLAVIAMYAALSLVCLLIGAGLLVMMVFKAEKLTTLGLVGHFYYILLLPLGLSVAGFLFGVLRSSARYTGKQFNGKLELSGSVVGFALVIVGGFLFSNPPLDFTVTVYVHGEAGPQDLVLRNAGVVWITFDSDRRKEMIGDKGQAEFKGVPPRFRGQKVLAWVEADGFESVNPEKKIHLDGKSPYLVVRHKVGRIVGLIKDETGKPIANATVRLEGVTTNTNESGGFEMSIPGKIGHSEFSLQVSAPGYQTWPGTVVPGSNDIMITLHRIP